MRSTEQAAKTEGERQGNTTHNSKRIFTGLRDSILGLTESLAGLDEGHGELAANGDLLEHASNLEVAAASEVGAVDGLDVVTDDDVLDAGLGMEAERGE